VGNNAGKTCTYRPGKVAIRFKRGVKAVDCQSVIFDASDLAIARTTRSLMYYVVTLPEGSENDFIMCVRDSPYVELVERLKSEHI
jgi:hypothetical protein